MKNLYEESLTNLGLISAAAAAAATTTTTTTEFTNALPFKTATRQR
jgi:hypothetical protein